MKIKKSDFLLNFMMFCLGATVGRQIGDPYLMRHHFTCNTLYNCLVCSDFVDTDLLHNYASCPACQGIRAEEAEQFL
jgi:hypothetical protein